MIGTAKQTNIGPGPFIWFILLVLVVSSSILLLAMPSPTAQQHADLRHGVEATIARTCLDRPEYLFYNQTTGRTALVCLVEDGKYGIVVLDDLGKEVTAFVKNKMKYFKQVSKYLENCGYKPIIN